MPAIYDSAISTEEAKKKLTCIENYLGQVEDRELIVGFSKFLATRLPASLVAYGFIVACELAMSDLRRGVNGVTGEKIESALIGYPPAIGLLIRDKIPLLAKIAFTKNFALQVEGMIRISSTHTKKAAEQAS